MTPGQLLATGRTADVFALDGHRVLRRYRDPGADAEPEARVMILAAEHGVPVPAVSDASGPELVMERVEGGTMLHDLAARPWTVGRHARELARLHDRIHAIAAPSWLDQPMGEGTSLLHLDLHPDNVVLSPTGPVVIDWCNAARGPGAADAALTWLLIATSSPPGSALSRLATGLLARRFNRVFASSFPPGTLESQRWAAAAWRLRDPHVLPVEQQRIRRLVSV